MDADVRDLVRAVHERPCRIVLALTGGGTIATGWLLGVPGGSRTVLQVVVPYAQEALDGWLAAAPPSYCSAEAAVLMARRARQHADWLAPGQSTIGIACTASLRSDRPKRGEHRVHVATAVEGDEVSYSLTLIKEARSRDEEDALAGRMILNALAAAVGVDSRLSLPLLPGEEVVTVPLSRPDLIRYLLRETCRAVCVEPDGRLRTGEPTPRLVVPGSFNPLHEGHLGMAAAASRQVGLPVAFELSAVNVEKPNLSADELRRRAGSFAWRAPLWLTRAPTFVEKAELFPGAVFVVGADTAERIVQPRYYASDMVTALEVCRRNQCRILVAARVCQGGLIGLEEIAMPEALRDLFAPLPGFRLDISSTQLRGG